MKALNVGPQALKGLKEKPKDGGEEKPAGSAFDAMLALMQGGQNLPKPQGPLTSNPGQDDGEGPTTSADAPGRSDKVARMTLSLEHRALDLRAAVLPGPSVDELAGAGKVAPFANAPTAPAEQASDEASVIAVQADVPGAAQPETVDVGLAALVDRMSAGRPVAPARGQQPVDVAPVESAPQNMAPVDVAPVDGAPRNMAALVERSAVDRAFPSAGVQLPATTPPADLSAMQMPAAPAERLGMEPPVRSTPVPQAVVSAPAQGSAGEGASHVEPTAMAQEPLMPAMVQRAATMAAAERTQQGVAAALEPAEVEETLALSTGLPKAAGVSPTDAESHELDSARPFAAGERPAARAHNHVAAVSLPVEEPSREEPSEDKQELSEVEVPAFEAQPMPEHLVKPEARAEAPLPNFEAPLPVPMTRAEAPLPTPEVERAMDLRAVQFSAEQGVTVQHPQLGEMSLAVTRQRGKVEVAAMVRSDEGARLVQANEQGMRMSVQAVGFPFGGLKVRVADRETRERKAQVVSRERAERRRSK